MGYPRDLSASAVRIEVQRVRTRKGSMRKSHDRDSAIVDHWSDWTRWEGRHVVGPSLAPGDPAR